MAIAPPLAKKYLWRIFGWPKQTLDHMFRSNKMPGRTLQLPGKLKWDKSEADCHTQSYPCKVSLPIFGWFCWILCDMYNTKCLLRNDIIFVRSPLSTFTVIVRKHDDVNAWRCNRHCWHPAATSSACQMRRSVMGQEQLYQAETMEFWW